MIFALVFCLMTIGFFGLISTIEKPSTRTAHKLYQKTMSSIMLTILFAGVLYAFC